MQGERIRDIHEPATGRLLCRFDPDRDLLEIQRRGTKVLIDLAHYRQIGIETLDNSEESIKISAV